MFNLDKETTTYSWVLLVGIVGGLLRLNTENPSMNKVKGHRKWASIGSATLSSAFVCWLSFEAMFYITQTERVSLAFGGFCAWQGAEWVRRKIDKALDKRLECNNLSQDKYVDYPSIEEETEDKNATYKGME